MIPPISRDDFLGLVTKIGTILAGNWEIKPNQEGWPMGARLTDSDTRASLYLNHHEGRLRIGTDLPTDAKGEIPYVSGYGQMGKRLPSITLSFDKSPYQIVKEIERRLMPVYMPILMAAVNQIASSDSYHDRTEGFAQEIARIVGVKADGNKVDFYHSGHPIFNGTVGRAEVLDDEVCLELRLSHAVTKEVLGFLIGLR